MRQIHHSAVFQLNEAPAVLAHYLAQNDIKVEITWPKKYGYVTPKGLKGKEKRYYEEQMDWLRRHYEALYKQKKTRRFAPHVLPYAAKVDIKLEATLASLAAHIGRLESVPLEYTKQLAASLRRAASADVHAFSEESALKQPHTLLGRSSSEAADLHLAKLVSAAPRNELHLALIDYFETSNLSWAESKLTFDELPYSDKEKWLRETVYSNMATAAQLPRYRFEIITEPYRFKQLAACDFVNGVTSQQPTPVFGYDIPEIEGAASMFERCFDISYKLFGRLQTLNPQAAPLAVLQGHRQRYLLTIAGLGALHSLLTTQGTPSTRPLINALIKELELKHPLTYSLLAE